MGVLFDYFRASSSAVAVQAMDRLGGPLVPGGAGEPAFDGVAAKGMDPAVALGQLVAFIREVPWNTSLVRSEPRWPPPETKPATMEEFESLPYDSPWASGPWLEELHSDVRDTLADVEDSQLTDLARRWAQTEEFSLYDDVDPASLLPGVRGLVELARRARTAGDQLYCWSCL